MPWIGEFIDAIVASIKAGELDPGTVAIAELADKLVQDPGALANAILRMANVYVSGDTFTIGTDVFKIDPLVTDSGDDTAGGLWNNTTNPLTVLMPAATYPVLSPSGTGPLILNELVYIGTEYLRVTGRNGDAVTFRRGAGGSTIAVHANAVNIYVSATRPVTTIQVGVQGTFTRVAVTPIFAATINEPAGAAAQSALVYALSLETGNLMLLTAKSAAALALPTTQVSTNGLWDHTAMRRGAAAGVKRIYRTAIVPDTEEATAEKLYVPLPFDPAIVLVRVVVTGDGKELETAAPNAVQKWDGATTIVPAATGAPAYVLLTAGTTIKWTGSHTLHILALE
jgi:hypothetical protein